MDRLLPTRPLLAALLLLSLAISACAAIDSSDGDHDNSNRGPLGKADITGSCVESDCDGPSDGTCWCDDLCIEFGDCCTDRVEVCEAPVSPICGGFIGSTCGDEEYCHYEEDMGCGFADGSGTCRLMPEICTKEFAPVCGCDGNTYSNSCMAAAGGTSVVKEGACDDGASECQPVLCELFCENGFATDDDGCEVCSCADSAS